MQTIKTWTAKGQESLTHLVDLGKQQAEQMPSWAVISSAAVVGGVAMAAVAKSALSVAGVLTFAPTSVTIGALGGGLLGWSYIQRQKAQNQAAMQPAPVLVNE